MMKGFDFRVSYFAPLFAYPESVDGQAGTSLRMHRQAFPLRGSRSELIANHGPLDQDWRNGYELLKPPL